MHYQSIQDYLLNNGFRLDEDVFRRADASFPVGFIAGKDVAYFQKHYPPRIPASIAELMKEYEGTETVKVLRFIEQVGYTDGFVIAHTLPGMKIPTSVELPARTVENILIAALSECGLGCAPQAVDECAIRQLDNIVAIEAARITQVS